MHKDETAFIASNAHTMPVEKIAERLNRGVDTVTEYIKLNVPPARASTPADAQRAEKVIIRQELRNSEKWKMLKQELTNDEIKLFEEEYIAYMGQFRGDVLPSEETQIFDVIRFTILKNRNMVERRKSRDDISRLEKMQEDFLGQFDSDPSRMSDEQKEFALNLETQLNASRQAESSRTSEYVKLQERQDALMKSLKSTRDQRIKELERNDNKDYLSIIKAFSHRDVQDKEGRQMALVSMAGKKEYDRLGELFEFEDGSWDSPILSPDTIDKLDEQKGDE